MIAARWVLTIVLGLLWFFIATANAWFAWRAFVRKEEQAPSLVPFVGGFIAYVAATVCPWDSPQKALYFWIAVLLDVGSLPYLALVVAALIKASKEEEHFWKRTYLESSWTVKLALGVFGWLFSLVLIGALWGLPERDETSRYGAGAAITVIYWGAYAAFHRRLKKSKPTGKDG